MNKRFVHLVLSIADMFQSLSLPSVIVYGKTKKLSLKAHLTDRAESHSAPEKRLVKLGSVLVLEKRVLKAPSTWSKQFPRHGLLR